MFSRKLRQTPTSDSHFPPQSFITLRQYFEDREWEYEADEERRVAYTDLNGDSGSFRLVAAINEDDDLIEAVAYLPSKILPAARPVAAEFLHRANYGMKVGHFELDYSDGTIRYHTSTMYADHDLTRDLIHHTIGIALVMADRYHPHLLTAAYGNIMPEEAVKNAEMED